MHGELSAAVEQLRKWNSNHSPRRRARLCITKGLPSHTRYPDPNMGARDNHVNLAQPAARDMRARYAYNAHVIVHAQASGRPRDQCDTQAQKRRTQSSRRHQLHVCPEASDPPLNLACL